MVAGGPLLVPEIVGDEVGATEEISCKSIPGRSQAKKHDGRNVLNKFEAVNTGQFCLSRPKKVADMDTSPEPRPWIFSSRRRKPIPRFPILVALPKGNAEDDLGPIIMCGGVSLVALLKG